MLDIVRATIAAYGLIAPGERIAVGLSGGPDSVALLHVLLSLSGELDFSVCAAHLNHEIRTEGGAEADESFVRELCEFMGVPLYAERIDVPRIAREKGWTLEQAGREERYAFFRRAKAKLGADKIALAHHRDDQAESILLHLTRGSGLTGLIGMLPVREDIIRPMLDVRRFEVEEFLNAEGIAYCVDATNLETGSTRNRLRLDVIPYIEEHINPAFVDSLCSMSELLLRDENYLGELAEAALVRARLAEGYDRNYLASLPLPIRTRALRKALWEAGAKSDIERAHIEQLIDFLKARTGARIQLPRVDAWISYESICFGRLPDTPEFETPFTLEGVTVTPLGRFESRVVPLPESFGDDRRVAYMDADKLKGAVARSRRTGDRIYPIGAPGRKKLKDHFIDRKVTREKRILPLLCLGDDVVFLPGFCTGNAVKVAPDTRRVLRVEYIPNQDG